MTIPPTVVGGSFRVCLLGLPSTLLSIPPTAVGGLFKYHMHGGPTLSEQPELSSRRERDFQSLNYPEVGLEPIQHVHFEYSGELLW
jgi:hypothetical protein